METKKITIEVSQEAAQTYEEASVDVRHKLDVLLSLTISDIGRCRRPLEDVIVDLSRKAKERGITEEALEDILNDV